MRNSTEKGFITSRLGIVRLLESCQTVTLGTDHSHSQNKMTSCRRLIADQSGIYPRLVADQSAFNDQLVSSKVILKNLFSREPVAELLQRLCEKFFFKVIRTVSADVMQLENQLPTSCKVVTASV